MRRVMMVATLALTAALSGCGYDLELNGAVFDYLGVSKSSQKPKGEPQVAARPGLVLPPDLAKLPAPGSEGQATATAQSAFPVNPEDKKLANAAAANREHEAFCREAMWKAQARGEDTSTIQGPRGPCSPSIVRSLTGKDISSGL